MPKSSMAICPQRLETGEEPQTVIHALDDALGHLDLQPLGRKTGLGQNGCHPLHVVVGAHLPDRHIDREPGHGEPFGQPLLPLPAGGAHHPFAQRFDETALLCHRNETVRGYHAKAGMLPADQGLQAAAMTIRQIRHGLVEQAELLLLNGLERSLLQQHPLPGLCRHVGEWNR